MLDYLFPMPNDKMNFHHIEYHKKTNKVSKLVGDLDYSLIRHSETELSDTELQYCINDVLVISAYIKEQIEKEKYIHKIPLTCTGYCRRFVRKNCLYGPVFKNWRRQFRNYHNFMKGLQITSLSEYEQLKRAFQGGFTHAGMAWSNLTIRNVDHVDFTSSYPYVLLSGIPDDKPVHDITRAERLGLLRLLKAFPVAVSGFRPIDEAIVTAGGVCTKEINPRTMESKLVSGLYFAGEVLDLDAYTGGFNLQIAWSTGYVAGNSIE